MINFFLIETHLSKPGLVIEIEKVSSIIISQSNVTHSGMEVSIHCAIATQFIQNKKGWMQHQGIIRKKRCHPSIVTSQSQTKQRQHSLYYSYRDPAGWGYPTHPKAMSSSPFIIFTHNIFTSLSLIFVRTILCRFMKCADDG